MNEPSPALLAKLQDLQARHDIILIGGGPKHGKSTLAKTVTDRAVLDTDYWSITLKLPWDDVPNAVATEAKAHPRCVIEGVRCLSVLRHGIMPGAVLWLTNPKQRLLPGQARMKVQRDKKLKEAIRDGSLNGVEVVYE